MIHKLSRSLQLCNPIILFMTFGNLPPLGAGKELYSCFITSLIPNYQWSSHSFDVFIFLICQLCHYAQDLFILAKWPFTFWRPRISDVYDRQSVDLDLGDSVTLPALITVFLAAFLASLVGTNLVSNMTRMLSLEFKVPEPLTIRAIPLGNYRLQGYS